jgi:N-acetylated-alpha-linked acidic dipeptidase
VGISSLDVRFEGDYGVYHSNYDSFHWMETFGDPNFEYHATLARIVGSLLLRLADDRVLPFHPQDYAKELTNYVDSIEAYAGKEFDGLRKAVKKLNKRTRRFERRLGRLQTRLDEYKGVGDDALPSVLVSRVNKANKRLSFFERGFIDPEGIASRPWFKHVVYAPSLWEGYSSQTFPAIAEAVDEKDDQLLGTAVERAIKQIYEAAEKLKMD